ncbi:hypothetical protein AAX29_01740 [Aliarcobacter thereius]|uniref:DUF2254 domain-containing protein n=1 Tax=Aliarcobacter thereius TaxID=544718 RepID=A0A1C0B5M0_9BACT|nr:hypothetical protein [Aliarcobacter thereius]OCL98221.1 hypothetical protein AAX29_01740 [Aliarcobacter thereius]
MEEGKDECKEIFQSIRTSFNKFLRYTKKYPLTILSLVIILQLLYFQVNLENISFQNILMSLSTIFATILALVFTLSLIPIQNAASMWTFSILKIYRGDKTNYIIFLFFSIAILVFIIFAIFEYSLNKTFIFSIILFFIGFIFDNLRIYYIHTISLINPQSILEKIKKEAFKTIDDFDNTVNSMNKQNNNITKQEAYRFLPNYQQDINYWLNDFAEIYQKTAGRNDLFVAKVALNYMLKVLEYALEKRKDSVNYHLVYTGLLPVKEADVTKDIIYPFCDRLKELFILSCKSSTENIALEVIETYKNLAIVLSKFDLETANIPIHYAKDCTKYAQSINSIEIPFQAINIIFHISTNSQNKNKFRYIDTYIIDFIKDNIEYLYLKDRVELAEDCIKYLMRLNKLDNDFKKRFEKNIEVIELFVPYTLFYEIKKDKLAFSNPLGGAYSLSISTSIGNIYQFTTLKDDINLIIIDMLDVVWRHLRKIAENYDIQNSFMIHEINSTIKHIADITLNLLKEDKEFEKKLLDKFIWLLSFYWKAYENKTSFNEQYLLRCIETLEKIAMEYSKCGYYEVSKNVQSHIKSILDNISKISKNENLIKEIEKTHQKIQNIL